MIKDIDSLFENPGEGNQHLTEGLYNLANIVVSYIAKKKFLSIQDMHDIRVDIFLYALKQVNKYDKKRKKAYSYFFKVMLREAKEIIRLQKQRDRKTMELAYGTPHPKTRKPKFSTTNPEQILKTLINRTKKQRQLYDHLDPQWEICSTGISFLERALEEIKKAKKKTEKKKS
jgi:DNA-directed RNA polymerase specialized sigma24 family protein